MKSWRLPASQVGLCVVPLPLHCLTATLRATPIPSPEIETDYDELEIYT